MEWTAHQLLEYPAMPARPVRAEALMQSYTRAKVRGVFILVAQEIMLVDLALIPDMLVLFTFLSIEQIWRRDKHQSSTGQRAIALFYLMTIAFVAKF